MKSNEWNLLVHLLSNPDDTEKARSLVQPKHFGNNLLSMIYEGMCELSDTHEGFSDGTLISYCLEHYADKRGKFASTISDLSADFAPIDLPDTCKKITTAWRARELFNASKKAAKNLQEGEPPDNVQANIETTLATLDGTEQKGLATMPELMNSLVDYIEEKRLNPNSYGVSTGYSKLDRYTYGLQEKTLAVLAARPSMGKSAFALNLIRNLGGNDIPCVFYSIEMPNLYVSQRMMASKANVPMDRIIQGTVDQDDMVNIARASDLLAKMPVYVEEKAFTVDEIEQSIKRMARTKGIKVAIIDYLQHIRLPGAKKEHEELGIVSRRFKELAKRLDISIVLLSQLNRNCETRNDKRPMLADLKSSGDIEQDADIVMMLYNESHYDQQAPPDLTELIIAKNRQGRTGTINYLWDAEKQRFNEMVEEYDV